jgi:hypothetical protein
MPLEPLHSASLSSKLRTLPDFPSPARLALNLLALNLLAMTVVSATFGQDQPGTPPPPAVQQQTPAPTSAPPEIAADDPDNGEPINFVYWLASGPSKLLAGVKAAVPQDQHLVLPGARSSSPGGSVSMPAGKFNHLELSYFQVDGSGTSTAAIPLGLFGDNIPQGDFLSTSYRLRNAQLTWNYLNWPVPPQDSKWRLHTLFAFDYFSDSVTVDAPYESNPNFQAPHGTRNIFYPSLGLEMEYIPSKHLYFQAKAWGFGIPHHADLADAEIMVVARVKHLEIFAGYKFFHFKTSPNNDQYFVGTLDGAMGGVRWVLR